MLKMTGIKLEKFQMGTSYIAKRHSKVNNKYMKNYDLTKPSKYILYLDMNNLYSWGMSQYLPDGRFKWLKNTSSKP